MATEELCDISGILCRHGKEKKNNCGSMVLSFCSAKCPILITVWSQHNPTHLWLNLHKKLWFSWSVVPSARTAAAGKQNSMNIIRGRYLPVQFESYIVSVCSHCDSRHYEWSSALGISASSDMGQISASQTIPPSKPFESDLWAHSRNVREKIVWRFIIPD